MSAPIVAPQYTSKSSMQKQPDSSPQPLRKPHNNKGATNQPNNTIQHNTGAMSDSNLPQSKTPKSKKPPRQKQQGDKTAMLTGNRQGADNSHAQRSRPASAATPNQGMMATPVKAAYAGPTFHASPAPSSLPVPRFFSKSVPGPDNGLQARLEKETDKDDASDSDAARLAPPARDTQQSPLDMFFKADREERAKRQSSSGLNVGQQSRPSSRGETPDRPLSNNPSTQGKDMFMMELDESESPVAKRSARPAPPRMTSERSRTAPDNVPTLDQDAARNAEHTRSLKDLLGLDSNGSLDHSGSPGRPGSGDSQGSPFAPRHEQRNSQGPLTPQHNAYGQPAHDLHYGNRNLSPLFQAARQDSPTRLSALRQEYHPSPDQPSYQSPSHNSPSDIARAYLQQQTAGMQSHQPLFPAPYQTSVSPARSPNPPNAFPSIYNPVQRGVQDGQQHHGSPGSRDVKSMEENLRRMLKLE